MSMWRKKLSLPRVLEQIGWQSDKVTSFGRQREEGAGKQSQCTGVEI